jgi:hypothetical protein
MSRKSGGWFRFFFGEQLLRVLIAGSGRMMDESGTERGPRQSQSQSPTTIWTLKRYARKSHHHRLVTQEQGTMRRQGPDPLLPQKGSNEEMRDVQQNWNSVS